MSESVEKRQSKEKSFLRKTQLLLSDFGHLLYPQYKKVFTWWQIIIGIIMLAFLNYIAYICTR